MGESARFIKLKELLLEQDREAHKEINFTFTEQEPIPSFSFDREQIKRSLINLLDNCEM